LTAENKLMMMMMMMMIMMNKWTGHQTHRRISLAWL